MPSDTEDDHSRSSSPEESGAERDSAEMPEHRHERDGHGGHRSSSSAKDPHRPRRKKARRACFACQRAHLTCGDERPCQRCIKRGLQDQCQDGVRKKAKYLHDAPNEALMPGAANNLYNQSAAMNRNLALRADSQQPQQQTQNDQFFSSSDPSQFNVYQQDKSMPPPMMQDASIGHHSFSQPAPISPSFGMSSTQSMQDPSLVSSTPNPSGLQNAWNNGLFDPNDPTLFNFDLASMNFGNHYGALEFGMLGHMATGAVETPPSDTHTQRGSIGQGNSFTNSVAGFSGSPGGGPFGYGDTLMSDWPASQNIYNQRYRNHHDQPHAFAIETGPQNFTSPDSNASPQGIMKFEESPNMGSFTADGGRSSMSGQRSRTPQPRQPHPQISTPSLKASVLPTKKSNRPRDPSHIYTSVTAPYPYTTGFHSLISFLQNRFASSPQKTLQIAKSLASIRPSFIATTKTLNRDDLIFMEKCFQRTLWEYESFIEGVGTPTIVARRTGEIAAVGKEFSILTGWKKEVLLGKEPNLNINRGSSSAAATALASSGANTVGSRAGGTNTPIPRAQGGGVDGMPSDGERTPQRPQPVFLAELLDDDTVVDFYEGFARLAFGDSRGSVTGTGKLLKYKTKEDEVALSQNGAYDVKGSSDRSKNSKRPSNGNVKTTNGIAGEGGMEKLGFRDGKVECAYCWTVKRDVFDIPMLIVMNFLPCI